MRGFFIRGSFRSRRYGAQQGSLSNNKALNIYTINPQSTNALFFYRKAFFNLTIYAQPENHYI